MPKAHTVGDYLIEGLAAAGIEHVFGVPGDYVLKFFDQLTRGPLNVINTCDEQGAGFAADAYARIKGLGAVCVTFGVGALKLVNSAAQGYAERSPMVIISGAPGLAQQAGDPLLHHKVAGFDTQVRIFEQVTAATAVLKNPRTAAREIDRVIDMARKASRPVYIELPNDLAQAPAGFPPEHPGEALTFDESALAEAVEEASAMLNAAKQPVVLAGVELARFGLQGALADFLDLTGLPFAATLMGKSVITETHPRFVGVYEGGMCREEVRQFVEESDGLLLLGAMLTDINTGVFSARLDPARTISASADRIQISRHFYHGLPLSGFLQGLMNSGLKNRSGLACPCPPLPAAFEPEPDRTVSVTRLFQCLNSFITDHHVVIADPGDALFGAADLVIRGQTEFISSAYYASLGFAVPAAIGVQTAAPDKRPLVLVGDGAFQMTGLELSTAARYNLSPIVLVLNNGGYGTERPMIDGPFNDVHPWAFTELPRLLGAGRSWKVETESQLSQALLEAEAEREGFSLLEVIIPRGDYSSALRRLTDRLGQRARA